MNILKPKVGDPITRNGLKVGTITKVEDQGNGTVFITADIPDGLLPPPTDRSIYSIVE